MVWASSVHLKHNFSNYGVIGLRNCLLDIVQNNNCQNTFRTMKFEVSKLICEKITTIRWEENQDFPTFRRFHLLSLCKFQHCQSSLKFLENIFSYLTLLLVLHLVNILLFIFISSFFSSFLTIELHLKGWCWWQKGRGYLSCQFK